MFYIVDKPLKVSSNLVAKILKRVLGVQKIGFAGTLDPLATGLMIIGTGGSPRLFPLIEGFKKTYRATIRLDGTTPSYDLEHPIEVMDISEDIIEKLSVSKIQTVIEKKFIGNIVQIPPLYSAIWVDGKRAYHRMRKGEVDITLEGKPRTIHAFEVVSYRWPSLVCEITVSHGTYIRSIARDMGILLGTGGYIEKLERTSIGHISMNNLSWTHHNDIGYTPLTHEILFPNIPILKLSQEEKIHLRLGSTPLKTSEKNGHYFVVYGDDSYGLLEAKEGFIFPLKNAV